MADMIEKAIQIKLSVLRIMEDRWRRSTLQVSQLLNRTTWPTNGTPQKFLSTYHRICICFSETDTCVYFVLTTKTKHLLEQ